MTRHRWLLTALAATLVLIAPAFGDEEAAARVDIQEGMAFPAFQGDTWTGSAFDLNDHLNQGKYILVDFWAAWCGPCMEEMPNVVKVMRENQNERFEIVTITLDNDATRDRLAKVVADNNLTFPIITDWQRWDSRYVDEYGVYGIPANFLLSPNGTVIMRDLRGDALLDITTRIANDPAFEYEPIRIAMTAANPPARLSAETPELPTEPLTLNFQISNPQVKAGAVKFGVHVVAYVDTGEVTLWKNPDGTFATDSKTGAPRNFSIVDMVEDDHYMEVTGGGSDVQGTMIVPIPEGTLDAELIPFTYSPRLDRDIEGKGTYPSYSTRVWMMQDNLEKQGGRIDPATADTAIVAADA